MNEIRRFGFLVTDSVSQSGYSTIFTLISLGQQGQQISFHSHSHRKGRSRKGFHKETQGKGREWTGKGNTRVWHQLQLLVQRLQTFSRSSRSRKQASHTRMIRTTRAWHQPQQLLLAQHRLTSFHNSHSGRQAIRTRNTHTMGQG